MYTWRDQVYWQGRFTSGDTPWELGTFSSVLYEALQELETSGFYIKGATVLSPGCGTGSDALELARVGARVIGIDWSELALTEAKRRYDLLRAKPAQGESELVGSIEFRQGDFFSMQPQPVDLVCEHTFFCAIDPSMRAQYIQAVASWIRSHGFLLGNFFILKEEEAHSLPGLSLTREGQGPPFATTREQLEYLTAPFFKIISMHPAQRPEPNRRPGMEWVCIFQRLP